jgi:hypothetical protein
MRRAWVNEIRCFNAGMEVQPSAENSQSGQIALDRL